MYKLMTDVQLTRRQRMCFVFNEKEELLWSGKTTAGAINFILEAGRTEFTLEGANANDEFVITATRL